MNVWRAAVAGKPGHVKRAPGVSLSQFNHLWKKAPGRSSAQPFTATISLSLSLLFSLEAQRQRQHRKDDDNSCSSSEKAIRRRLEQREHGAHEIEEANTRWTRKWFSTGLLIVFLCVCLYLRPSIIVFYLWF